MILSSAPDIAGRIEFLLKQLNMDRVVFARLHFFRSTGSTGRATARIWSLPKIWQTALNTPPGYCLEVISEKFDRLSPADQERVLIHELLHIPKFFSGGLVPHRSARHRSFHHYRNEVETLFNSLNIKSYER